MTLQSLASLFFAMLLLAAIPSTSVLTVVVRSLSFGFWHGSITALGILVGDIIFILFAIYGLSMIATLLSGIFIAIKCMGGIYLLIVGLTLWRTKTRPLTIERVSKSSWLSSFLSGLSITLGDQKAILFYLGFLPAFVELSRLAITDVCFIIITAIVAIGGVKLFYAYIADRAKELFQNSKARQVINRVAGSAMILTGLYLVAASMLALF